MKNFEKKNFILVNIKLLTNNEIACLDTILNHNDCEIILEEDNFDYTKFY